MPVEMVKRTTMDDTTVALQSDITNKHMNAQKYPRLKSADGLDSLESVVYIAGHFRRLCKYCPMFPVVLGKRV